MMLGDSVGGRCNVFSIVLAILAIRRLFSNIDGDVPLVTTDTMVIRFLISVGDSMIFSLLGDVSFDSGSAGVARLSLHVVVVVVVMAAVVVAVATLPADNRYEPLTLLL